MGSSISPPGSRASVPAVSPESTKTLNATFGSSVIVDNDEKGGQSGKSTTANAEKREEKSSGDHISKKKKAKTSREDKEEGEEGYENNNEKKEEVLNVSAQGKHRDEQGKKEETGPKSREASNDEAEGPDVTDDVEEEEKSKLSVANEDDSDKVVKTSPGQAVKTKPIKNEEQKGDIKTRKERVREPMLDIGKILDMREKKLLNSDQIMLNMEDIPKRRGRSSRQELKIILERGRGKDNAGGSSKMEDYYAELIKERDRRKMERIAKIGQEVEEALLSKIGEETKKIVEQEKDKHEDAAVIKEEEFKELKVALTSLLKRDVSRFRDCKEEENATVKADTKNVLDMNDEIKEERLSDTRDDGTEFKEGAEESRVGNQPNKKAKSNKSTGSKNVKRKKKKKNLDSPQETICPETKQEQKKSVVSSENENSGESNDCKVSQLSGGKDLPLVKSEPAKDIVDHKYKCLDEGIKGLDKPETSLCNLEEVSETQKLPKSTDQKKRSKFSQGTAPTKKKEGKKSFLDPSRIGEKSLSDPPTKGTTSSGIVVTQASEETTSTLSSKLSRQPDAAAVHVPNRDALKVPLRRKSPGRSLSISRSSGDLTNAQTVSAAQGSSKTRNKVKRSKSIPSRPVRPPPPKIGKVDLPDNVDLDLLKECEARAEQERGRGRTRASGPMLSSR